MDDEIQSTLPENRPAGSSVFPVVIAFLVGAMAGWYAKSSGMARTVPPVSRDAWELLAAGDALAGKSAFQQMQCSTCHRVAGHPDLPAPTADPVVPVVLGAEKVPPARKELVDSILAPSHRIEPGYNESLVKSGQLSRMGDYSHVLTVRQLGDLVAFLESAPSAARAKPYE